MHDEEQTSKFDVDANLEYRLKRFFELHFNVLENSLSKNLAKNNYDESFNDIKNEIYQLRTKIENLQSLILEESNTKTKAILEQVRKIDKLNYHQIESLLWLEKKISIDRLPHTRGWATSPDVLLHLHDLIMEKQPEVVVEFGSGTSTLVIADALRQCGKGRLFSVDHSEHYGGITRLNLVKEELQSWVDLRIFPLIDWKGEHLNKEEKVQWYDPRSLEGVKRIEIMFVDGPPAATCRYARYPALPAVFNYLDDKALILIDDANRTDEMAIYKAWADRYKFSVELFSEYEKGLAVLKRI